MRRDFRCTAGLAQMGKRVLQYDVVVRVCDPHKWDWGVLVGSDAFSGEKGLAVRSWQDIRKWCQREHEKTKGCLVKSCLEYVLRKVI